MYNLLTYEVKTMNLDEKIKRYTEEAGISAFEDDFAKMLLREITPLCDEAYADDFGNVIGICRSADKNAKKIMFEAHMDKIGLMISKVRDDGLLSFVNLGGVDERILPYSRVEIFAGGRKIPGVIGTGEHDGKRSLKIEELFIDTGLPAEEVKKEIRPGAVAELSAKTENMCTDTVCGAAMDNRAGAAAIISALEKLEKEKLPYTICCVFTTQEELGLHGAFAVTDEIVPDFAVAVDVTHGMTPDTKDEIGVFPLGSGAAICRGPNFNYGLTKRLISLAKKKNIPYTIEAAPGPSGTTAWAIQIGKGGIPVMLVSIPLRYMHTNVETLSQKDVRAVRDLLIEIAKGGL